MFEINDFLRTPRRFSTAIQQVDYPSSPLHNKFYFVGSIPAECYDYDKSSSKYYNTEQEAIDAAKTAGAERIQRTDCSFVM